MGFCKSKYSYIWTIKTQLEFLVVISCVVVDYITGFKAYQQDKGHMQIVTMFRLPIACIYYSYIQISK